MAKKKNGRKLIGCASCGTKTAKPDQLPKGAAVFCDKCRSELQKMNSSLNHLANKLWDEHPNNPGNKAKGK